MAKVLSDRKKLERLKELRLGTEKSIVGDLDRQKNIIDNKKKWITYYRENPEIYIETRMGFHSFGYQNFSYHLMNEATNYSEVTTRGCGKSLRCVVFATAMALLYPYRKIGLTAVGISQAEENYLTAFLKEVKGKYSPFIRWLWDNGYIWSEKTSKGYVLNFWNGSVIYFMPCIDSSRGLHFSILIGEELRLIKKGDWDDIAVPMLEAHRPNFRNTEKYRDNKLDSIYNIEPKTITITSNRTKNEWFNRAYNSNFVNYFRDRINKTRVFSADIFLALHHGLKTSGWYFHQRDNMDELSFKMEILNETIGEVEGAFFTWEQFRKNQSIKRALIPPNPVTFKTNNLKNRQKKNGEVRLVFADFAFTDKNNKNASDNTCLGVMSIIPKGGKYYRLIEFIETRNGGDSDGSKQRVRELFWDFGCDYIVFDSRNGGDLLAVDLSKEFTHPYRTLNEWNSHGFTACLENDLHMVGKGKVDDLRSKCVDPYSIPCLIPITASRTSNSDMWLDLGSRLKSGEIQFLIDDIEFETDIMQSKAWHSLADEEKVELRAPHLTTQFMINEAVNLKQTWTEGYLKLNEPLMGTKDCIVAVAYGNYIASKIINKLEKSDNTDEFDASQWKLVW